MLSFHEHIVGEVLEEDGLVVIGAGLGLHKVIASILHIHLQSLSSSSFFSSSSSSSSGSSGRVLFILSASDAQRQAVCEELRAQDPLLPRPPLDINNEYSASDRLSCYADGGAFFVTSRILIVDLLNERFPPRCVAGLVVLNAHRLSETCTEAFIARLFRRGNPDGFIRAFSDKPQAMVGGFSKAERIMRSLYVRRLHLWPRFQVSVASTLEESPPEVVDIRVPPTAYMQAILAAILEVMDACLKELRKTNTVDVEDLTVESGLFKSFDEIVRRQLDPIWHVIGRKTKQLVSDLRTLRKLADYVVRYDSVTFLKYLETLRVSEGVRSVWIFASPSHRIFEFAKRRVFQIINAETGKPRAPPPPPTLGQSRGSTHLGKRGRGGWSRASRSSSMGFSSRGFLQDSTMDEQEKWKRRKLNLDNETADDSSSTGNSSGLTDKGQSMEEGGAQGFEVEVLIEEMPKWKVLREVLEEIEEERQEKLKLSAATVSESSGIVLVICKDERTCMQLQECLIKGPHKLMSEEWEKYLLGKVELRGVRTRKKKPNQGIKGLGILDGRSPSTSLDSCDVSGVAKQEQDALLAAAAEVAARDTEVIAVGTKASRGKGVRGRGRGRGKSKNSTTDLEKDEKSAAERGKGKKKAEKEVQASSPSGNTDYIGLEEEELVEKVIRESKSEQEEKSAEKALPPVHFYALESEQRIMDIIMPSYVVVYDHHMAFVREMEVFKAEHPTKSLKVYFLLYDESTEVQKFEASIRRENTAFESLIRQKASMMIPVDQDGRVCDPKSPLQSATGVTLNALTRKTGGRKALEKQMQVVVDMREFSSSLPCVLHQQGMRILPVTLEVGDYILSPDICVERKSISDLFQSFASGRLYHQAETMSRYYRIPVLLIEFSQDKRFSLQSSSEVGDDILRTNIISKLSLLVLHFPRLRLVWSRSLHATADIFAALKANQDEPDVLKAMKIGVPTEDGLIEGDIRAENYNTSAVELLRRLPGVTDANYRSVIDGCKSLEELAFMPVEKLAELLGGNRPARMLREFLDAKYPVLV